MRFLRTGLIALLAALPLPALAQVSPPQDPGIVVQGQRGEAMSGWYMAETDHVIVYSDGSQSELKRIDSIESRLDDLEVLVELANAEGDQDSADEATAELVSVQKVLGDLEVQTQIGRAHV